MFKTPSNIKRNMDKILKTFLWFRGTKVSKATYYLVSWNIVCQSKEQGFLGRKNIATMNISLLA
jgi:hypothetical protein